jgi:3'(2'), 5'-bisphosphate nucleotidase
MSYQKELTVVLDSVLKACGLCREVQNTLMDVEAVEKKDRSPVTVADLGSQAVINIEIMKSFPNDSIVAEEETDVLQNNPGLRRQVLELVKGQITSVTETVMMNAIDYGAEATDFTKRYWTLDPIDGTKGFLRGEQYAIALALVEAGEVVLGVLGCPNLSLNMDNPDEGKGCLFYAVKGQGTFMKALKSDAEKRVFVDRFTDAKDACFCESVEKAHASHDEHAAIASKLGITTSPFRIDSQAKYAAVARGNASIYLRLPRSRQYREKIWDHAAGVIVVTEAGGKVTDFGGKPLDFMVGNQLDNNEGILVTNGHLHNKVLEAIAKVI